MRRAERSRDRGIDERRFNAFVSDDASGGGQARANVVRFQPGVALQHDLQRVAGGQYAKDMLDGEPAVPDDRLAAEDGRVRRDSTEEVRFAPKCWPRPTCRSGYLSSSISGRWPFRQRLAPENVAPSLPVRIRGQNASESYRRGTAVPSTALLANSIINSTPSLANRACFSPVVSILLRRSAALWMAGL